MKLITAKKLMAIVLVLLVMFTTFTGCGISSMVNDDLPIDLAELGVTEYAEYNNWNEDSQYVEGVVLVKCKNSLDEELLSEIEYESAEPIFSDSQWYSVKLTDPSKTKETVDYLKSLDCFDGVDYDYVMKSDAIDVSGNPDFDKSKHFGPHGIQQGWNHINDHGRHPGGDPNVIVAVIDTGIDYEHIDLRNNIWVNPGEIPGDSIDNDNNGYVDDVYGWNCVGNNNKPLDDNGHGTHVAGVIAAENNSIGGVGIAYNCKIMVIKAGNSSGYFNNSDIAEAIQYAYMNGASVINMSFGGSNISMAVEDALKVAYTTSVLVAAAGNDGMCNGIYSCASCPKIGVSYPAALPYVIGVMSVNKDGSTVSEFSNYDHCPYDTVEYEVYAVGEGIPSTWPGNKYATMQGTSMAAPSVSGIAALLRSYYTDRDVYSSKFIQSQIVNTGTLHPYNNVVKEADREHSITNIFEALTEIPKPDVKLHDYYIDDSTSISKINNGNGVADAGETVRLYVSLRNIGSIASNVNVTIDAYRGDGKFDEYFTFTSAEMSLSDIGTYSVRESGDKYFEIVISPDCPNDYLTDFNINFTYTNGMDPEDNNIYSSRGFAQFNVSRGYYLPSVITEDTVFGNDKLYIVAENVTVPEGVTVTFTEGCEIQFYADREYYSSPEIIVYGTLNILGSEENMVKIYPSERFYHFTCGFDIRGSVTVDYAHCTNVYVVGTPSPCDGTISHSYWLVDVDQFGGVHCYRDAYAWGSVANMNVDRIADCYVDLSACYVRANYISNTYFVSTKTASFTCHKSFDNNVFYSVGPECGGSLWLRESATNNKFISSDETVDSITSLEIEKPELFTNNTFSSGYKKNASVAIKNYINSDGTPRIDINDTCSDESILYPHIVDVSLYNANGEKVTTVGTDEITVRVTFNRAMDTTADTMVTFGSVEPYGEYELKGEYISDTVWEGKYTVKAQIVNGLQKLRVRNAWAAEDPTKIVQGEYMLYEFNVDTAAALAMNLYAEPTINGVKLTWVQDDYDTLMGYNIYRSESKNGYFRKINTEVLLPTDESFVDTNAVPGTEYWYTFTVVLSDFSESAPAGKVSCLAVDNMMPNVYHTPVSVGYQNNDLVISCLASDEIQVAGVTLYYRSAEELSWNSLPMTNINHKYSAAISGGSLSLAGLEYYIAAYDGYNRYFKGDAESPYKVVIIEESAATHIGDINLDGEITPADALMITQSINGSILLSDDQFKRADLNGDGILTNDEALRILQFINGNVDTLAVQN